MRTTSAATLSLVFFVRSAAADPTHASPPPVSPPTFAYTTPADPNAVRAMLELGGVLALGFAWYATTSTDIVRKWDVGYDWPTFRRKLTGEAFGSDTNHFGTNFIGHPLGGTGYYLSARSNRLSILQSFGYSVAGSLFWELFGEVSEVVSMNDTLVTPLGGLAIGEATTQLGAFFDRSGPSGAYRVLGATFGPFKTVNDALDGLEPARASSGFPKDEWHRFEFSAGTVAAFESLDSREWWPEARLGASSRLARFKGYEAPGGAGVAFDDGNLSGLAFEVSLGASGLSDLSFGAATVLAGYHFRGRSRDLRGAEYGGNGVLGVETAFRYALHDYRRAESGPLDRVGSITPLGVLFEQRGALGKVRVDSRLAAGPSFAGVTPHSLEAGAGETGRVPAVLERHGYYFGLGGELRAELEVARGPTAVRAALHEASYRSFTGPGESSNERIVDFETRQALELGHRLQRGPVELRALVEHRSRSGRRGRARASSREFGVGAGFAAVF